MHKSTLLFLLTSALFVSGTACGQAQPPAQADALTEVQVRALLVEQGYTNIDDVEFDDGTWEADVTSTDGKRIDVRVDPATRRVFPENGTTQLGENDIKAKLTAAGYSNVHDVEFDDGMWKAEADDSQGREVDIYMDPADGRIVHVDND